MRGGDGDTATAPVFPVTIENWGETMLPNNRILQPPDNVVMESRALNLSKNQVGRPAFFVSTDFEQITRDTLIYTTD